MGIIILFGKMPFTQKALSQRALSSRSAFDAHVKEHNALKVENKKLREEIKWLKFDTDSRIEKLASQIANLQEELKSKEKEIKSLKKGRKKKRISWKIRRLRECELLELLSDTGTT